MSIINQSGRHKAMTARQAADVHGFRDPNSHRITSEDTGNNRRGMHKRVEALAAWVERVKAVSGKRMKRITAEEADEIARRQAPPPPGWPGGVRG